MTTRAHARAERGRRRPATPRNLGRAEAKVRNQGRTRRAQAEKSKKSTASPATRRRCSARCCSSTPRCRASSAASASAREPGRQIAELPSRRRRLRRADRANVRTRFTDAIDGFSVTIGRYVAYWAVLAVFSSTTKSSPVTSSIRRPTGSTKACS